MKKYLIICIGLFYVTFLGCDGSFEEALFAINLEYPDPNSKCEKGVPNGDKITLPFRWKPQGDIKNFELVLNDNSIEALPIMKEDGSLEFKVDVEYSEEYTWRIKSNEVDSETRSFNTPSALPNDNGVPLAVTFDPDVKVESQSNSTNMTINWEGEDLENNGDLRYDAYWSKNANISPDNEDNGGEKKDLVSPPVTFQIANYAADEYYYILVVARDSENSAFSVLKYCQLCDN